MNTEEIKKLTPQERVAGYLARDAKLAEIGCRLRVRHHHESTDYDEKWTPEEEKEWDDACDDIEPWFYALSDEEKQQIWEIVLVFSQLARGEWPISVLVQRPIEELLKEASHEAAQIIRAEQNDPAAQARIGREQAKIHAQSAANLERMEKGVEIG